MKISLKRFFNLFYFIVPFAFWGIPFLVFQEESTVPFHFFKTVYIETSLFLYWVFNFFILAMMVKLSFGRNNFLLSYKRYMNSYEEVLLYFSFFGGLFIPLGYIVVFFFPVFFLTLGMSRIRKRSFFVLYVISFLALFLLGERLPFVLISLLVMIFYFPSLTYRKLIILCIFGVVFLVFILQPLRSGSLPFTSVSSFSYLYQHLSPIYVGAYLFQKSESIGLTHMLAESILFGKTIFATESVIDIIGVDGLTLEAYNAGTRHGSSSTMFFNNYGWCILTIGLAIFSFFFRWLNWRIFNNAILIYLIVMGPFFIRRSFSSYLIDLTVFLFCAFLLKFLSTYLVKRKSSAKSTSTGQS